MEEMWQLWTTHSHDVMAQLYTHSRDVIGNLCTHSHDVTAELWRVWDLVQQSVVAMLAVLMQVAEGSSMKADVWGQRLAVGFVAVLLTAMMCRIVVHVTQGGREATKKRRVTKCSTKPRCLQSPGLRDIDLFDLAKTAYRPGYAKKVAEEVERRHLDINQTLPSTGMSLFLCSCLSGSHELVHKLIKKGCDVNAANDRGNTPLHQAAMSGNIPLIKLLLKHGSDPYIANSANILPIDCATNTGHLVAAKLLRVKISAPDQVWDVVEPHTPLKVTLGFMTPSKNHLADSSFSQKRLMFHSC
ncbi:PREDICTED: tankyrase-2-like isoform X2 [Branchiostoma belcheri]|uniref:Tankyrase-2-like isoform X2 n=1 Tax=Branchiostoma belcheri TaxID=7741 RepID=A0A6P4ZHB6_BRABE|nr:PREDICTED: tankyrase-2-like isoform X2 [Branchiostoma belcheri]